MPGICRQLQRGKDLAQKQPGAVIPRHEVRVLALPAEPRQLGNGFLHHRGGVHEHLHVPRKDLADPTPKRLQTLLDHVVIIASTCINGQVPDTALVEAVKGPGVGCVSHRERDDGPRLGPERRRFPAPVRLGGQPVHLAMQSFVDESREIVANLRGEMDGCDSDRIEAKLPGLFLNAITYRLW